MSTCDCFTGTPGDQPSQYRIICWLADPSSLVIGNRELKGTTKTLYGLNVYQALASADVKGEILFLPDVFGLSTHSKILADEYASFGWSSLAAYSVATAAQESERPLT
ncbi:dienelactone hydrolase family domain-containing protein [Fusarium phyllophilum]|uniref:Dienelactone hydrolase family domain-containing protein n=1 Tax=Fusarium phyllophilum TaxID=47803 RepID=A0A8H5ID15_9HYPO|nr:dienelactone hydrolase family domain-containing protein [Fusarium phyllophilum]